MNELKYIRVMEHELYADQIRIGQSFPILSTDDALDKAEKSVIESYEKKCVSSGGFEVACGKYYKRIAIVDAETLEVLRLIYSEK